MDDSSPERRRVLRIATSVLGLIGGITAAIPFVRSMNPSARALARGGPATIEISGLHAQQQLSALWRGKPIWILHRDGDMLRKLDSTDLFDQLSDPNSLIESQQPEYTQNAYRSIRAAYFVAVGLCTHLGCVPSFQPKAGSVGATWPGGYFCPCHGSKFDLAGSVYKNVPAPTNLVIPPHRYIAGEIIQVGVDS